MVSSVLYLPMLMPRPVLTPMDWHTCVHRMQRLDKKNQHRTSIKKMKIQLHLQHDSWFQLSNVFHLCYRAGEGIFCYRVCKGRKNPHQLAFEFWVLLVGEYANRFSVVPCCNPCEGCGDPCMKLTWGQLSVWLFFNRDTFVMGDTPESCSIG